MFPVVIDWRRGSERSFRTTPPSITGGRGGGVVIEVPALAGIALRLTGLVEDVVLSSLADEMHLRSLSEDEA